MKIKEVLEKGNNILKENNIKEYSLKTRILLANILDKSKEFLMIHDEEEINEACEKDFFEKIENLKIGIPIQYIINKQEFMGIDFFVDDNVLIPQPDTEILVQEILEKIKPDDKILDLCTGSGAIGFSIGYMKKNENLKIVLSDVSEDALTVAKKNAEKNGVDAEIIESDLFENIEGKYDIIVSNPPYIDLDEIENLSIEVKNEPFIALFGGKDGLSFYRKIASEAKKYLNPNGILGLEIGYSQKDSVTKILEKNGYIDIYCKKDLGGNDRVIICRRGE